MHSWNAFQDHQQDITRNNFLTNDRGVTSFGGTYGQGSFGYKHAFSKSDIIKSVITRIALDASMVDFKHLKIDPLQVINRLLIQA